MCIRDRGDLRISNTNITNNKCEFQSSIYNLLSGTSSTCNFTTFGENNQTGSNSLYFYGDKDPNKQTISYCNIIGNKCGTGKSQYLFYSSYNTNIDHSIFLCNIAKYMFYPLFEDYTLTISDSYIESQSKTGPGIVTFVNLKQDFDFNTISHIFIEKCIIEQKEISVKLSYLSKLAKNASPALFSSR